MGAAQKRLRGTLQAHEEDKKGVAVGCAWGKGNKREESQRAVEGERKGAAKGAK